MGRHRCASALLVALPATFMACKATARPEFHLLGRMSSVLVHLCFTM